MQTITVTDAVKAQILNAKTNTDIVEILKTAEANAPKPGVTVVVRGLASDTNAFNVEVSRVRNNGSETINTLRAYTKGDMLNLVTSLVDAINAISRGNTANANSIKVSETMFDQKREEVKDLLADITATKKEVSTFDELDVLLKKAAVHKAVSKIWDTHGLSRL